MRKKLCPLLVYTMLTIIAVLPACSVNQLDIQRYQRRFSKDKEQFNALARALYSNPYIAKTIGHSINNTNLPDSIQEQLKGLDIDDIDVTRNSCNNSLSLTLITDWSSNASVNFIKDTCDPKTKAGFHEKQSEMIEVWGLGEGWLMLIDYDFL